MGRFVRRAYAVGPMRLEVLTTSTFTLGCAVTGRDVTLWLGRYEIYISRL